jgi:hypothetical protein
LITTDAGNTRVCSNGADHRWPDDGRKQGCPFCAGHRLSSTNRFSAIYPDDVPRLDQKRSGVSADQLSVGSGREVWWHCDINPEHPSFKRIVNTFLGGHKGNGTKLCPECRLVGTSVQELQLKAELATVLRIDPDRKRVVDAAGRSVAVDIVAVDEDGSPWLVLEFDGVWWHDGKEAKDAAKADQLRETRLTVVRIREAPLTLLDPVFDVHVGFQAAAEDATADILEHLAALGLIDQADADRYRDRAFAGPQNRSLATEWIRARLGEAALRVDRSLQKERWARMYAALVDFEAASGHCYPSDREVMVEGANLARWVRKQRALLIRGKLGLQRAQRLEAISSWSRDSAYDAEFRAQSERYHAAVTNTEGAMAPREATVWANNLRTNRQRLVEQGADLPAWKIEIIGKIPGWSWNPFEEGFLAKVVVLQDFAETTQRTIGSIKQREEWDGHKIGVWVNSFRSRRQTYTAERIAMLEELPGWAWTPQDDTWNAALDELAHWAADHDRMPKAHVKGDETERRLGVWKRNNKSKLQARTDDRTNRLRTLLAQYGEVMA